MPIKASMEFGYPSIVKCTYSGSIDSHWLHEMPKDMCSLDKLRNPKSMPIFNTTISLRLYEPYVDLHWQCQGIKIYIACIGQDSNHVPVITRLEPITFCYTHLSPFACLPMEASDRWTTLIWFTMTIDG